MPQKYIQEIKSGRKSYFYSRLPAGHRVKKAFLGNTLAEAETSMANILSREPPERERLAIGDFLKGAVHAARKRAKDRGMEFDLTIDAVIALVAAQNYRCAISGADLSMKQMDGRGRFCRPFAPSLDRIDAAGGYTKSNVRVTSRIANFAMNQWGEVPLREMLGSYYGLHREQVCKIHFPAIVK
jgi:hypothetical protein